MLGDVPIVGRTGYIIALIVVGLGGGAGLFVASTALNMRDARRTARLLLGEDNFEAAMASDRANRGSEAGGAGTDRGAGLHLHSRPSEACT